MSDVTLILNALELGDDKAVDRLLPAVYQELRLLAAEKLSSERSGHTLQATALVHETYLRLIGLNHESFKSRAYFFGAAAEAMRRILIENARRKKRLKRGGEFQKAEILESDLAIEPPSDDLLALDEALDRLAMEEPAVVELVKLRYFAGMTMTQTAQIMDISRRTADRYWAYARAWLHHEIRRNDTIGPV